MAAGKVFHLRFENSSILNIVHDSEKAKGKTKSVRKEKRRRPLPPYQPFFDGAIYAVDPLFEGRFFETNLTRTTHV